MKQGLFKGMTVALVVASTLCGEEIQDYGATNFGLSRPARPMRVASLPSSGHGGAMHSEVNTGHGESEGGHGTAPVVVNVPAPQRAESSKLVVDVDGSSELGQLVKQIKEELSAASKQRMADLEHAKKLLKELDVYKKRVASERAKSSKLAKKVAVLNSKLRAATKEHEASSSHDAEHAPSAHEEKPASRVPGDTGIDLFEECPPQTKKEATKGGDAHAKADAHGAKAEGHGSEPKEKADAHGAKADAHAPAKH